MLMKLNTTAANGGRTEQQGANVKKLFVSEK
jgi:hypothetical protein